MALTDKEMSDAIKKGLVKTGTSWKDYDETELKKGIYSNTSSSNSGNSSNNSTPNNTMYTSNGKVQMTSPSGGTASVAADAVQKYLDKGYSYASGSSSSGYSNNYIDDLAKAKLKSTLSALDKSRSSQLGALSTEKATIKPYYQQAGLQARGQSGQGARSFSEYLASKGLSSSGVAAQGEINRMGTLQGTLGNLGQQEVQAMSGIAQRESDVNNAYSSDVSSAKAGNQADLLAAKIQQQQLDQAREDSQRQLDAENELAKTKYSDTQLANQKSDYSSTIGQFGQDYQAEINKVQNDGDPSNDWQISVLAAARQQKISELDKIKQAEGKLEETKQKETVNNAIQMFGQLGYLTPQMVEILKAYGLTQADITRMAKPKSTGSSTGGGGGGGSPYGLNWD